MKKVAILFSTFNSAAYVGDCLKSCLTQDYEHIEVIVADDGSSDSTIGVMKEVAKGYNNFHLIPLPHGERGIARYEAVELAKKLKVDFIYIIDSDMILKDGLVSECVHYLEQHSSVGGLVIPELAFSNYKNFFSKVKVFERNIINNAGEDIGSNSIEAARFWKMDSYLSTGGINPKQISFEEIQPTIRYLEEGGTIKRATFTGVYHDEKHVTLKNILEKKRYYFSVMDQTINNEEKGFIKALSRWYFFRPVLYRKDNVIQYGKHPILTAGMFYMYFRLTLIGVIELAKSIVKNK